jgi:ABC-2 type transport system permease protein
VTQYPLTEDPVKTPTGDQDITDRHVRVRLAMPSRKRKRPKSPSVEFLFDVYLLTKRLLMRERHQTDLLVYSIVQPAVFTLMLTYVLGNAVKLPQGTRYVDYAISGLLAQTIVSTAALTATAVAYELSEKTIDRLRTLPVSRLSILASCTNGGLMRSCTTVVVTAVCGLAAGWRTHTGAGGLFAAFFVLLLFGLAMSWCGALIGVSVSSPQAAAGAGSVWLLPIMYVSNALVPVHSMPGWLQPAAEWNPMSAVTTASRQLFGNPAVPGAEKIWPTEHAVITSVAWSLAIISVTAPVAVRKFLRHTTP